jgi:hypothetical protein
MVILCVQASFDKFMHEAEVKRDPDSSLMDRPVTAAMMPS